MPTIYHGLFLAFTLLAAVPVLNYYYKRNPIPRFRPSFGEMTLVSLIALIICLAISWPMANLMESPESIRDEHGFADQGASEREATREKYKEASKAARSASQK
jgi:hypothetical protein